MKTKYKIAIARWMYGVIHRARTLAGRSDTGVFKRRGLNYELDLSQGIDLSIYIFGSFEPQTAKALSKVVKPGDVVLDIGANVGAHTLPLARLVGPTGRVVACEPTDFAFRKLQRNLALNPDLSPRVEALQCFLSGGDHDVIPESIYSGWPLTGGVDLHPKHFGSEERTSHAVRLSVDDVVASMQLSKVDCVKMDVDGFECDVLSGASRLLSTQRPKFVMELSPYVLIERGASLELLISHFVANDYEFFDEASFAALPMSASKLDALIGDGASRNIVAQVRA